MCYARDLIHTINLINLIQQKQFETLQYSFLSKSLVQTKVWKLLYNLVDIVVMLSIVLNAIQPSQ